MNKNLVSLATLSIFVMVAKVSAEPNKSMELKVEPSHSSQLFVNQVRSSNSVGTAVRTFIARYPEKSVDIVKIAFDTYPERFRQILSAAVSTQPAFVDEFLKLAIERDLAEPTELLRLAIIAEPSYAEFAAEAACKFSPENFNELDKTAVLVEPDSADQIAKTLVASYPNKALDILVTTIKEVPLVGKYVIDALLALFPMDSSESESMIIISVEQLAMHPEAMHRLTELARDRGIEEQAFIDSAMRGGLSEDKARQYTSVHY